MNAHDKFLHGMNAAVVRFYPSQCRYCCERYGTACGRSHGSKDRADWARDTTTEMES